MRLEEWKVQEESDARKERIVRAERREEREERALALFERIVKACELIAIEAQHAACREVER